MTDDKRELLPRLPSGIPGLDLILKGGFLRGGVYIFQGTPGAGKTIFGNQIAFNHIARGGRAVYITLLAESHARMALHLRSFSFFDERQLGKSINYFSAFSVLEDEGLRGLASLIRRELQGVKDAVIVLDGFVAAGEHAQSETELKKLVHELQTIAGLTGCTMFLLSSGRGQLVGPEHTMVDGLLALRDQPRGALSERILEVTKFRGSSTLRGEHAFRITDDGIVIFPRLEAALARPGPSDNISDQRVRTGIKELDSMIAGGLPSASTTLLLGPSGTGKTSLGLHFLARASADEPGLLFGFFETPQRLLHKAHRLGLDLNSQVKRGHVEIIWQAATENLLDELGHRLLNSVERSGAKRVFIDGLHAFRDATYRPERISHFFSALTNEFRLRAVTAIYTLESPELLTRDIRLPIADISAIAESVFVLRFVEWQARLCRLFSVLKMRDSEFDPRLREFIITGHGITLAENFTSAEEIMSGFARSTGTERRPSKKAKSSRRR